MGSFELFSAPRIVFGRGQISRLGSLAADFGQRPLVIQNVGQPGDGGLVDRINELVVPAVCSHCHFLAQGGEPTVDNVSDAVNFARRNNIDMIIGLGGGSAIDTAKAVAGVLSNPADSVLDFLEVVGKGRKITRPALPWIAVPTTAGTGAEVTRNAVIGYPQKQFKASIRSELLLPRIALVDPELGVGVPSRVTACSGMDALCQLIESYTSTGAQPITDALAIQGITMAGRSLRRAFADGGDLEAREDMAMAALLSGMTLTNAGLGAVHGFAAPIGANFPAPHGAICARLLPLVIEANVRAMRSQSPAHRGLERYAAIGRTLSGQPTLSGPEAIEAAVRFTADLGRDLRIPSLGEFGMNESSVPAMVALAKKASSMKYNPVVLSDEVLAGILQSAILA